MAVVQPQQIERLRAALEQFSRWEIPVQPQRAGVMLACRQFSRWEIVVQP